MHNPNFDNVFYLVSALLGRTGLAQLENDVLISGGMGFHPTGVVLNTLYLSDSHGWSLIPDSRFISTS
jgi:hypothetical protein